jgi:hypothetical protein
MDDIVRKAMAKWPNVPHCYGWLALDARGAWRMRDERAQSEGLPGDRVSQVALRGFINRNYAVDAEGRWYFQNGPQRVYVNLETTPYIARTDHVGGFLLHTGEPVTTVEGAWMTVAGRLVLRCDGCIAMIEDRDLAECMAMLRLDGRVPGDEDLLGWLDGATGVMTLALSTGALPVERLADEDLGQHFGYVATPVESPQG